MCFGTTQLSDGIQTLFFSSSQTPVTCLSFLPSFHSNWRDELLGPGRVNSLPTRTAQGAAWLLKSGVRNYCFPILRSSCSQLCSYISVKHVTVSQNSYTTWPCSHYFLTETAGGLQEVLDKKYLRCWRFKSIQLTHKREKESKHLDLTEEAEGKGIMKVFSYPWLE